ncbi:hypothetical protein BDR26DRAFT_868752 [Obelidium mucronatum]|nr:hypothetical protein BDR26DRAFT_868752 [Obelidium mucronatum]
MADTPHVASKDPVPDSSPIPTSKPGIKKIHLQNQIQKKRAPSPKLAASDIQESPPQPSRIPRRSLTEPPKESSNTDGSSKAEEKPPPPPEKSTSVAVTTPATTSTTETLLQPQPHQKKESQISLVKEHSSSSLVSISKKKLIAIDKPSPASDSKKGVGGGSSGGTDKSYKRNASGTNITNKNYGKQSQSRGEVNKSSETGNAYPKTFQESRKWTLETNQTQLKLGNPKKIPRILHRLDSKADLVSKSKRSLTLNTAKNGEIAAEITKETKQKPSEKSKPPKPGPTTESKTSKATKEPILASSPSAAAAAVGQKRQKSASEPPVQKPGKLSKLSPSDGKNLAAPPPVKLAKSSTISKSALAASNSTLADSSRSSILKNASKINTLSKSKASLNDSDDKPIEKAKSRSKADLAAAKQRTSEPSPDTVVDGSNSRLQRNLRLRAKLKLDVDGCFAMGLCAPTSLIELEQVPKVIPGIPCPLPLKRHPSARRTVMKTIGYPATGWTPIDSKEPETVEEVKQYRFRRAKSLEDASHPLPFGHHGTYNEFKALRGDGDEPQNLEEQKSYEDAMMESFGFTAPFTEEMAKAQAETLKRPTTVQAGDSKPTPRPVTNNKQTTSNSIRAKPQSAQEMHIASAPPAILPPLAKPPASLGSQVQPNISENSVKYLQQYMDRAKKAGREPPAIPVSKPQQQQQQQHKIETASQAHRKAPITAIVPSENVGILPSSRIRELSATKVDTERYSSIVQKRSGWEPGREETGLFQNDERTSKSLDRGFVTRTLPTRESTRPATQIGFGDVDPFGFDIETPRLGSPIARSIIAGQKASGKPRVLKVKPKTSPVMPRKSKMGVGKMKGKPLKRIELESEPVDTNPAVARASENNSWFYPGGSEMTTSGIYQQPGMYPMNVGGPNDFQHLNSQYNPLQLHQQVMQTHFPWMYNFNCYPQAPAPKLPVQANVSFENDNKVEPPLKPKKGGAKAQPKSSLKKSKAPSRQSTPKNQQKQQSPVISTGNMSHALPQDRQPFAALPNYNMIQNMPLRHMIPPPPSQQQQHSSSHPQNLQHNQPFVPPTLMPARIRLQNVPVVTLQQAMVIEATGEPPGSVGAFPGHSEMMMQPTYINNGPFGGMGMYAGGMMNRGDWQEQGRNALNQATEHVEEIHSKEIVEPKKKTVKLSEKPKSRSGVRAMIQKGLIGRHRGGI